VDTWIKGAEKNPNPKAELEIIEQVKNETNSAGETMSPAQPKMVVPMLPLPSRKILEVEDI
jgi:hypothetical protein